MRLQTSLSPRQLLLCGLCVCACLLLMFWWSQRSRGDTAEQRLRNASKQLQQLQLERETFAAIQAARAAQPSQPSQQEGAQRKGGRMYALLEQALTAAGLAPHVQYLRPDNKTEDETHVNETLSASLRRLDRAQLVTFLHATEIAIAGLAVESLNVTKSKDGFADVEVVFTSKMAK